MKDSQDQQIFNAQPTEQETDGNPVSLSEIFTTGIHKWKWIVASVIFFMAIGVLYILRTPNVYTANASLEIKNDENSSSMNSALSTFSDLGLGSPSSNFYNEMTYLESPDLMEMVVAKLGLQTSYYLKQGMKRINVWRRNNPVEVTFLNKPADITGSFKMEVNENGKVKLSKFKKGPDKLDFKCETSLGKRVRTPLGTIEITEGAAYEKGENYNMTVNETTLKKAAQKWSKAVKVDEMKKDATVVSLSVSSQSADLATAILSTLIESYNQNWILDKNQIAVATSQFINERLGVIESELGNVDNSISSYKSANLVPDIAANAAMYMTENQENNRLILEINNQLQMTRFLREHLSKNANNSTTLPVNTGIGNKSIEEQLAEYNTFVLNRNSLIANSSENNPVIRDLDNRLAALRGSITASLDNQIKALSTQMQNLRGSQGNVTAQIAANPTQAKYLLSVERQQKVKESLYLYLLQKREENELTQAFTAYNTRIVERPAADDKPTSPKKGIILGLCFLFGLFCPFGVIYVRATTNTTVRGRDDLKTVTAPFLGEIPAIRKIRKEKKAMLVEPGNRNLINEAFRVVRTNLSFLEPKDCNLVMVTSFNPGSGKTFFTMNIAESLAIRGVKTLVIDGDIRRGSSSEYIDNPKIGLAQYLAGKIDDINEIIMHTEYSKDLYMIPAGQMPPNPTELLENGRFEKMIENLKKEFKYIFIDCPPVQIVADARIIGEICDRTIFVVRAGLLRRAMVPAIEQLYKEKVYRNMTIVLNGAADANSRYGYNYGYNTAKHNYYAAD